MWVVYSLIWRHTHKTMRNRFIKHINKGLIVILFVLFAATVCACIYFSRTMITLNSQIQQTGESVRATVSLQALLRNMQQAESGQRGYLITGDKSYLTPYQEAVDRIPGVFTSIDSQSSLNSQRDQIDSIKKLSEQRLSELANGVRIRDSAGFEAAMQATQEGSGETVMIRLRTLLLGMVQTEYKSINPSQSKAKSAVRVSAIISSMLVIFVLAMCGIILRYVRQAIVRERAIEGAKNEFLSLASHQLRTPATSVKQYLGMLDAGYFGNLNDEQKEALDIAYKSNETGISIINNLLNAAKLSLGKIELTIKNTQVDLIVEEVIDEYKVQLASKRQSITFSNRLRGRKARLDSTYIKTVIENLVDNAIKYSPEGTVIRVHLAVASVTELKGHPVAKRPKMLELSVSDSGVGISKGDIGKLFKKFSRLDNDFSATSEGSGLGLYWVKQVVMLHGGSVAVRSKQGKGSKFTMRLPLTR